MSFVNRVIDFLASEDVIDLYFVLSDLVEIDLSEAEICETAEYDRHCEEVERSARGRKKRTPLGKLVL